jgi:death-on-curing protein
MKTKYLDLEEILRLHFWLIEEFGGSHGVRDENRLKSVVEAPKQFAFGNEQYPSVHEKAAVYLRNIIGDHPFQDGNKRTAITVCSLFLKRNGGFAIDVSSKELEEFTLSVATEHLQISVIVKWLKDNTQKTLS